MRDNPAHVRLLTLLNVSAAVPRELDSAATDNLKATRVHREPSTRAHKRTRTQPDGQSGEQPGEPIVTTNDADEAPAAHGGATDAFVAHFGAESADLAAAGSHPTWNAPKPLSAFGGAQLVEPHGGGASGAARVRTC